MTIGRIINDRRYTPSVIGVYCNSFCFLVNDGDYIALKVLDEVVRNVVVKNTAYRILVIVERNKGIVSPCFTENLGAVESIGVSYAIDSLACSNTVSIEFIISYEHIKVNKKLRTSNEVRRKRLLINIRYNLINDKFISYIGIRYFYSFSISLTKLFFLNL